MWDFASDMFRYDRLIYWEISHDLIDANIRFFIIYLDHIPYFNYLKW